MPRKKKKEINKLKCAIFITGIAIALIIFIFLFIYNIIPAKQKNPVPVWGVTYSPRFAEELKLDWKQTFISILDELQFRDFRLAAYWDEIEPINNHYNFSDLDWMIDEIEKRNGTIILAIGRKNLRWPECFLPDWTQDLTSDQQEKELLEMIRTVVSRYQHREVILMWQLENEVFFPFGRCPEPSRELFIQELGVIKSLDDRKIMLTDSGELSTWRKVTPFADVLGITMYRDVSNPLLGDFHWPNTPEWYSKRAWFAERQVDKVLVAEFQMEPWYNIPFTSVPIIEQYDKFDILQFKENVEFAKRAGFERYYIWGVEWWYYMKKHNFPIFWETAKTNFNKITYGSK